MLEEKTKGNLTAPEANFLANTLYELRMGYVRALSRHEAAAQAETTPEETGEEIPSDVEIEKESSVSVSDSEKE